MKKTEKALLRELKISAKKARINKIAQEYINHILIFVAIVILSMLSFTIYSVLKNRKQKIYSGKFNSAITSLQKEDVSKGMGILENIFNDKRAPKSIKSISGLRLARLESAYGNNIKAIRIFKEVYKNDKKSSFAKYLAGTSAATLMINQQDKSNTEEINELLNELLLCKKNPLKNLAMEQKGIFNLQQGNLEEGIKILNSILQDNSADKSTKDRINDIIKAYK